MSAVLERVVGGALAGNDRILARSYPVPEGPLDPGAHPWTRAIEAAYPEIRREVDALVDAHIVLPTVQSIHGDEQGSSGRWTTLVLYSYGHWIDATTARMPRTTDLLKRVPDLMVAGLTVLGPDTRLPRHRGPARGGLRYQVGIRVPDPPGSAVLAVGDVVHHWEEGSSILFDDITEHEAWNDGDADRYVLFVEFAMPASGLAGLSSRMARRLLGVAGRGIPARVAELDRALNG